MLKFQAKNDKVDIKYNGKILKYAKANNSTNAQNFVNLMNNRKRKIAKLVNNEIVFIEK